jgi:7-carboxy-7-deazaguanine synthase
MTYSIKEIFYTLQGEGANTGRPAVFCRFAGCNLWTGREQDRDLAVCQFCDTDFVGTDGIGGGKFSTASELADKVAACWPREIGRSGTPLVVCTGGEPLLQLDETLIHELHVREFEVAVETNGTQPAPEGLDWICVSPKADAEVVLKKGNELKLVYLQEEAPPERFADLEFEHFFLQPMDGPERDVLTQRAITYCKMNPKWRLSLQMHKIVGIL